MNQSISEQIKKEAHDYALSFIKRNDIKDEPQLAMDLYSAFVEGASFRESLAGKEGGKKSVKEFEEYMVDMIRLHEWVRITDIYDHFDKKRTEFREFMVNHIALFDNDWACDIVQNTCQLINGIKPDGVTEGWWSEWDESVLKSLIELLKKLQLNYGKSPMKSEGAGWVRVEDGLPKYDVDVFVWMESGNFSDFCIARMIKGGEWYRPFKPISDVTHWQPLPPAPLTEKR